MNRDFAEMLAALCEAGAEFLIVGAHALAAHGTPRATGDLDIWVRPTAENAPLVLKALKSFGAPLFDLTLEDLATPGIVFQMGLPPARIDILTGISGVEFSEAWPERLIVEIAPKQARRRETQGSGRRGDSRAHAEAMSQGAASAEALSRIRSRASFPSRPRPVHRREVRVRHHHLVSELLQAPRDPLALRRGLDQRLRPLTPQH